MEGGKTAPIPRAMKPVIAGFIGALLGLIMTIACMNLANMLLARGAARRKELAIRLAVGASRFRLMRQLMTEGVLLSMLAGIAGFAFAYWLSALSSKFQLPQAAPQELAFSLDWRAALFTFALAILCGIGFSIVPALQSTKTDLAPTLKQGGMVPLRGYRRFGMRNLLMVGQVAGSLMLLLITGFLVMGFSHSASIRTRFDANTMYLFSLDPVRDGYSAEKTMALFETLPLRLKASGAVSSIALASEPPFSIAARTVQLAAAKLLKPAIQETVGAGYFATLSEPMLRGRELDERDQRIPTGALPVVLNESAAHSLFGNGNAIGQRITEGRQPYDVVGVVRDLNNGIADEDQPAAMIYVPLTSRDFARPPAGGITILVRSSTGKDALHGIQREIASMDPNLGMFNMRTLNEYLDLSRAQTRLALDTYAGIGAFGLVLAAIGLAGVTAYTVARRRKEIGIRMALGARKAQVLRLVLREGAVLVAAGTALGFLGAMVLVKLLSALTSIFTDAFNVSTNDPRLVIGAPLLLGALAMLACYIPARRSAKIDPLQALREE